jgi:hypothetical protein
MYAASVTTAALEEVLVVVVVVVVVLEATGDVVNVDAPEFAGGGELLVVDVKTGVVLLVTEAMMVLLGSRMDEDGVVATAPTPVLHGHVVIVSTTVAVTVAV